MYNFENVLFMYSISFHAHDDCRRRVAANWNVL